jgi:hypothetical protein
MVRQSVTYYMVMHPKTCKATHIPVFYTQHGSKPVCSLMDEDITIVIVGTCINYMCKAMNNSNHISITITLAA